MAQLCLRGHDQAIPTFVPFWKLCCNHSSKTSSVTKSIATGSMGRTVYLPTFGWFVGKYTVRPMDPINPSGWWLYEMLGFWRLWTTGSGICGFYWRWSWRNGRQPTCYWSWSRKDGHLTKKQTINTPFFLWVVENTLILVQMCRMVQLKLKLRLLKWMALKPSSAKGM